MPRSERKLFNDVTGRFTKAIKQSNSVFDKIFGKTQELIDQLKKSFKKAKDDTDSSNEISGTLRDSLEKIPLIGKWIAEGNFDRDSLLFVKPIQDSLDKIAEKAHSVFTNMSKYGKTAIVSILAVLTLAVTVFKEWDESIHNFVTELGATRIEVNKLIDSTRDVYLNTVKYGATMEDVFGITSGLVTNIGLIDKINKDLVETSTIISKRYGLSADATAQLITLQKQSLGYTNKQVRNFALMTNEMSKIAGVLPGQVMKDIAENSENIAKFSDGSAKSILKSSVYAKSLGSSYSEIAGFAEKILDLETSIDNAMKSQFYFGVKLDVGRARQLVLENDIAGAHRLILKQLSEEGKLNLDNYFQRQQLAEILGVSVDKAMQMVNQFKLTKDISDDLLKNIEDVNFDQSMKVGKVQGQLKQLWNTIKYTFAPLLQPLLESISWSLEHINNLVSWIGSNFNKLAKINDDMESGVLKFLGKYERGLLGILAIVVGSKGLIWAFKKLTKGIFGVSGGLMKMPTGSKLGGLVNSFNPKSMLASGAAMIMLAGATWILAKAMQEFSTGVDTKGFWMAIGALTALTIATLVMGTVLGTASPLILLGAAAFIALSAGLLITANAAIKFATAAQMIIPVLDTLKSLNFKQLIGVALGLNAVSAALIGFTGSAVILGIGSFLTGGVLGKLAHDIELLVSPLTQVADEAHRARMELLSLSGANGTRAVIQTVSGQINNSKTGIKNTPIIINPANVILDGKKVGKIVFQVMQGE